MRPIVLMDVDGVIADFCHAYLFWTKMVTGKKFTPGDVTQWEFADALNLSSEESHAIDMVLRGPDIASGFGEYPGSVRLVKELMTFADVVFVTSPFAKSPTWAHDREWWLKARFGEDAKIIHTKHKQYVDGDFMIDDGPHNLAAWEQVNIITRFGYCVGRPWNGGKQTLEQIVKTIKGYVL